MWFECHTFLHRQLETPNTLCFSEWHHMTNRWVMYTQYLQFVSIVLKGEHTLTLYWTTAVWVCSCSCVSRGWRSRVPTSWLWCTLIRNRRHRQLSSTSHWFCRCSSAISISTIGLQSPYVQDTCNEQQHIHILYSPIRIQYTWHTNPSCMNAPL